MLTALTPAYRMFARSDVLMALCGAVVMAVAGAGMANVLGTGAGGVANADTYTTPTLLSAR